jgi:hypothetical protein
MAETTQLQQYLQRAREKLAPRLNANWVFEANLYSGPFSILALGSMTLRSIGQGNLLLMTLVAQHTGCWDAKEFEETDSGIFVPGKGREYAFGVAAIIEKPNGDLVKAFVTQKALYSRPFSLPTENP